MASTNSLNTITVDGITYNAAAYESTQQVAAKSNELDKEAFLQLLVAQLQHQDPLEPQDNGEFIAQMAQFSSLEQMSNMTKSMDNITTVLNNIDTSVLVGQLSGMIGKGVEWLNTESSADENGNPVTQSSSLSGTITGVTVASGVTKIIAVDAEGTRHQVDISNVAHVYELGSTEEEQAEETVSTSAQMVGQLVSWEETDVSTDENGETVYTKNTVVGVIQEYDKYDDMFKIEIADSDTVRSVSPKDVKLYKAPTV